ncbi:MAG: EAL domain-containing protein, partial [Xanthobacteraceae bacterium]
MSRLGALFIVVCMALIAASVGALLFLLVGLSGTVAAIAALAVLSALAIYHAVTARMRDRSDLGAQIADMSRGNADLALQVAEIGRRTAALEGQLDNIAVEAAEKAHAATKPITAELGELGNLVKQLAQSVALYELKIAGAKDFATDSERNAAPPPPPAPEKREEAGPPERSAAPAAASGAEPARDQMLKIVRDAIDANRTELYLQPIVTLPQRKVRYYEAFTWLRAEDATLLQPSEFLDTAEAGGLMPQIDNMLLFRSIQVIRRLQLKNRDIGLFCGVSVSTLNDAQLFPQILQFMDANRALGSSFVLQFQQKALLGMGP